MAEKKCTKCGTLKPLDYFYRMAANSTGYGPWCKVCMDARKTTWNRNNRDKQREMSRRSAKKNYERNREAKARYRNRADVKERMRGYSAEWYRQNKGRLKAVRHAWYLKNKIEHNANSKKTFEANKEHWIRVNREWARTHREKMRGYTKVSDAIRRNAIRASSGTYTAKDIKYLAKSQRGLCTVCREPFGKYHVDHIVPLSRGGTNDKHNIQLLCASCNIKKHAKDPIEFMQSRGYLL